MIETLITAASHSLTGIFTGTFVDQLFPPYVETKSDLMNALELSAQFSLGFLALGEMMNVLIPNNNLYQSPIGDGKSDAASVVLVVKLMRKR